MSARRLSRRDFLRLAAMATTGAVLAACAPQPEPATEEPMAEEPMAEEPVAEAPAEVTTVSIQTGWYTDQDPNLFAMAIAAFEDKPENADLDVDLIAVGTTPEDMLTSIAGGTAPDIYHTYGGGTGSFNTEDLAPRGVAIALDEFLPTARYFKKDDYYPEQWAPKMWDGKIWGLPVTEGGPGGYAFSWHKRMFEDAGFDPEVAPDSWDAVVDYTMELTTYEDSGAIDVEGFDPHDACGNGWGNWSMWYDTPGISEDKKTVLFDQGNWPAVLQLYKDIYQGLGVELMEAHQDAWSYWTGGDQGGFNNGKRAMILNGYWQPGELANTLADQSWEIGYGWPPCTTMGKKVMTFGGTHTLWMTSATDHPQEAFRLMDYFMSTEVNIMNFELRGGFVLSKPLLEELDTSKYSGLDFFMQMRQEADHVYTPADFSSPIGAEMRQLWDRAMEEVIYGQKEPEEALLDITGELQESLDAAWEALEG